MVNVNINIAFCFDERVFEYAAVAIASLLKNRGEFHYDIYLVVPDEVWEEKRSRLRRMANELDSESRIVFLPPPDVSDITPKKMHIYFRNAAYWRIKLCEVLPKELKYIIYVDFDILFLKPLDELANVDFGDKWIAVVVGECTKQHERNWEKYLGRINQAGEEFNSGLMVINLAEWRKQEVCKKFVELKEMDFDCPDQTRLNMVCFGHSVHLNPLKYNVWGGLKNVNLKKRCSMLHFSGGDQTKPWTGLDMFNECKLLWWEYARSTPFYEKLEDELNSYSQPGCHLNLAATSSL